MDWKSLPAFLAVARSGSLRAGAAQVDGTHATVRRQIEGLEAQLGTALFRRTAGGLTLTAAGRRLLPQAIEAEAALLKGFSAVKGLDREASGRIRLSADPLTAHYLLAPVLADFAGLYPEIEIPDAQREAWLRNRTGIVVGRTIANQFGLKVGDRLQLQDRGSLELLSCTLTKRERWRIELMRR